MKRLRREIPSTSKNFLNVPVAGNSPAVAVRSVFYVLQLNNPLCYVHFVS